MGADPDAAFSVKADKGALMLVPGKQRDSGSRDVVRFQVVEWDAGLNTEGVMERAPVAVVDPTKPGRRPSDGSAMGAVDDEEQAEATALPEPSDDTPIPPDPETQARRALLLDVVGKLTAEASGAGCRIADLADDFNARRRMGRKKDLGLRTIKDLVADAVVLDGQLIRSGGGHASRLRMPDKAV